jgi:peptidoglycan hydrolase CwlO-like protein
MGKILIGITDLICYYSNTMKKIINLSLVILMSFVFSSCCMNCKKECAKEESSQALDDDSLEDLEALEDNLELELETLDDQGL